MAKNSGEREEVYFDSVDHLCTTNVNLEDHESKGKAEYGVWISEPQSVSKRRDGFLRFTGFSDLLSLHWDEDMYKFEEQNSNNSSHSTPDFVNEPEVDFNSSTMVGEESMDNTRISIVESSDDLAAMGEGVSMEERADVEGSHVADVSTKRLRKWWRFLRKRSSSGVHKGGGVNRVCVRQNGKRWTELSAVYVGQELHGHDGYIWVLKFDRDGRYLASGGEDGVVRIWRVISIDSSSGEVSSAEHGRDEETSFFSREKKSRNTSVVVPKDIFGLAEPPLHEFFGHSGDVIDLDWSNNNCLISCSKDKTIRLWKVGSNECLNVFEHRDYVTCVDFNPVDENLFASGSMDGKVRVWGVADGRVVDWVDVIDAVTALCYDPIGKGIVVGSTKGTCRFYTTSEGNDQLDLCSEMQIRSKKKSSPNMITGIQFSSQNPQRVMITSEDSKIRVFEGNVLVHKCKGLRGSGNQTRAAFTRNGRHVVSVGSDSRVYLWADGPSTRPVSKRVKSTRVSESFFVNGLSVAVPWPDPTDPAALFAASRCCCCPFAHVSDPDNFSLRNCFNSRRAATWPEESLLLTGSPSGPHTNGHLPLTDSWHHRPDCRFGQPAAPWGLVLVAATQQGTIMTFHNYGLPEKT